MLAVVRNVKCRRNGVGARGRIEQEQAREKAAGRARQDVPRSESAERQCRMERVRETARQYIACRAHAGSRRTRRRGAGDHSLPPGTGPGPGPVAQQTRPPKQGSRHASRRFRSWDLRPATAPQEGDTLGMDSGQGRKTMVSGLVIYFVLTGLRLNVQRLCTFVAVTYQCT